MTPLNRIVLMLTIACPYFSSAQSLASNNGPSHSSRHTVAVTDGGIAAWPKADDQLTGNFNRTMLTRLKATSLPLVTYLKDSCLADSSLHPVWHGEYSIGKAGSPNPDIRFGIRCDFSPAVLSIMANDLSPILGQVSIYGQDYATLASTPVVHNQCPYFDAARGTGHVHSWVVTQRPEDLPYTIITRKDYLGKMLTSLATVKEHIIADVKQRTPVRTKDEQEAAKNKELETFGLNYSGAELQMRKRSYLENYKSDEDYQQENIDKATADVDSTVSFIDGMLHRLSPATLGAPAVVSLSAKDFEGFADGEAGSAMLVEPKAIVADATTGPEKPRFFVISCSYTTGDVTAAGIERRIGQRMDVRMLRELLK